MKAGIKGVFVVLFGVAFLAGCRSGKQLTTGGTTTTELSSAVELVEKVESHYPTAKAVTAKVKFALSTGKKSLSTSGTLRMKEDDVIQLSLKDPILGAMEVARLEITTDKVLLIDRYNQRYAEVQYSDAGFLKASGLGFYALQALFRNELFQPSQNGGVNASVFTLKQAEAGVATLSCTGGAGIQYLFRVDTSSEKLTETEVTGSAESQRVQLSCAYSDFKQALSQQFPNNLNFSVTSGTKQVELSMQLSDIKENDSWETRTTVNKNKYTEISVDKLINILKGL